MAVGCGALRAVGSAGEPDDVCLWKLRFSCGGVMGGSS